MIAVLVLWINTNYKYVTYKFFVILDSFLTWFFFNICEIYRFHSKAHLGISGHEASPSLGAFRQTLQEGICPRLKTSLKNQLLLLLLLSAVQAPSWAWEQHAWYAGVETQLRPRYFPLEWLGRRQASRWREDAACGEQDAAWAPWWCNPVAESRLLDHGHVAFGWSKPLQMHGLCQESITNS